MDDILVAVKAIRAHLERGDLSDGLVFDAVRVRLIEIGEAVKALSTDLLGSELGIPWEEVSQMRDRLTHRYFDTSHAIVTATVEHDVPELEAAIHRLVDRGGDGGGGLPTKARRSRHPETFE